VCRRRRRSLLPTALPQPLHWCCIGVALVLHWCCIGVALVLHWCCIGVALEAAVCCWSAGDASGALSCNMIEIQLNALRLMFSMSTRRLH
jgi:hypothetical protein